MRLIKILFFTILCLVYFAERGVALDVDKALTKLREVDEAIANDPENADLHFERAVLFYTYMGNVMGGRTTIDELKRAISLAPEKKDYYLKEILKIIPESSALREEIRKLEGDVSEEDVEGERSLYL